MSDFQKLTEEETLAWDNLKTIKAKLDIKETIDLEDYKELLVAISEAIKYDSINRIEVNKFISDIMAVDPGNVR